MSNCINAFDFRSRRRSPKQSVKFLDAGMEAMETIPRGWREDSEFRRRWASGACRRWGERGDRSSRWRARRTQRKPPPAAPPPRRRRAHGRFETPASLLRLSAPFLRRTYRKREKFIEKKIGIGRGAWRRPQWKGPSTAFPLPGVRGKFREERILVLESRRNIFA